MFDKTCIYFHCRFVQMSTASLKLEPTSSPYWRHFSLTTKVKRKLIVEDNVSKNNGLARSLQGS